MKAKDKKIELSDRDKDDINDRDVPIYPKAYDLFSWFSLFKVFIGDVREESSKVTWPTRKEASALAVAVFVLTFFFSIYLGAVDLILSKFVEFLIK